MFAKPHTASLALPAVAAAKNPPSRREQIKHHFHALKALLEEEFQCPWLIITCTEGSSLSRILSTNAGKLNDPYGIIGPVTRYGEVVS
ncbi:hypothetical protein D3227_20630 [Mesorhizobium waimense]|uniref:Uncharacterized protein n=1 Tax=Mesorhizobium waimense TaxID=1300307 RepID=A0A3A5KNN9_9HYPH|nr:hypothetical protein D3227_20630 [Mesorhizobium waimense]